MNRAIRRPDRPAHHIEEDTMNAITPFAPTLIDQREDMYYAVHKGIRLANARMLIRLGRADAADAASVASALASLREHLVMGLSHLTHENAQIHTAIEERCPGASEHAADDHAHHEQAFADLEALARAVERAREADRAMALRRLYQRFALFVAEDLEHMHEEETQIMPLLMTHFTAEERAGIEHRIVSNIPFEKNVLFMRCMIPALPMSDRKAMIGGMRAAMPAEVFDGLMTAVLGTPWMMDDYSAFDRLVA
jgi:iron-sulfur cluster repair protein YtfE (RIC family)